MDPQGNDWSLLNLQNMKIALQAKVSLRLPITTWFMKIPDAKAAVDKEWKKLETIPSWQLEKIKSKKGGNSRSTTKQKESTLLH